MSSGTKCGYIGCEVRTEGVVTGRVFHYHRDLGTGFVLAENRGNTVIRAHVSSSIGIMHPYWGL